MQRKKQLFLIIGVVTLAILMVAGVVVAISQHMQLRTTLAERDSYAALLEENKKTSEQLKKDLADLQGRLQRAEEEQKKLREDLATAQKTEQALKKENGILKQQVALKHTPPAKPVQPIAGKVCYLTFDDGPSANVTPKILDTLKKYGVKATFFVVGTGRQEYITRAAAEGHAIGLHCGQHVYSKVYASENAYWNDLGAISNIVKNCTGKESFLVRFPGGSSNTASAAYTKGIMTALTRAMPEKGYHYFDWNVDSNDAAGMRSAAQITGSVLSGAKGKQQICVLMHDASGKSTTAAALPAVIEGLKKQGFSFAPLTTEVTGFCHRVAN